MAVHRSPTTKPNPCAARDAKIATASITTATKSATATLPRRPRSPRAVRTAALVGAPSLVLGVALAAANLRPAVTSLASVLDDVRISVGAGHAWASALTAVPAVCFGAAGLLAPRLSRRFGLARALGWALALLTAGLALRVLDGPPVVLGGTLVACAGIAVGNVLIPVVIKQSFPHRIGAVTAVYTAALAAGGGLGAAATPWLAERLGGWRGALAAWALLGLAAVLTWLATARHGDPVAAAGERAGRGRPMRRSPLAWTVTAFFGLQALVAYTVMGWLPEVYIDAGVDRPTAGVYLAVSTLLGVPLSLVLPPVAARARTQSAWIVAVTVIGGSGLVGLLVAPAAAPLLWAVLAGFGMGVFPLAITVITLRTRDSADTATLSAMAQSIGYLIGALGPFAFGLLRGLTGGWTASLVFVLCVVAVQVAVGYAAGRDRTV
ncbi:MFS transporter [Actinokineospora iranica]|uniref:MFS transporter, CP family, cyanate transporter n=1 Tax=Actinokineospora iranica TaxID=1271860 RepID=A0A1G6NF37_9PSEU|nr:MFS transporter [Actinokineospora iranica]SDC66480.1 MFS transporter, CP family, cyanate transporter [Actinokineospora iranica]